MRGACFGCVEHTALMQSYCLCLSLSLSFSPIVPPIQICISNKFYAGALGPGTIVGSAAFNLMFIIGICMVAIPSPARDTEVKNLAVPGTRRIEQFGVFQITAIFSIAAYLWLLVILLGTSPDIVDIWEGTVTLLFFPLLTIVSYIVDCGVCSSSNGVEPGDNNTEQMKQFVSDNRASEEDEVAVPRPARRGSMYKFFTRAAKPKPAPQTSVQMLKESGLTKIELLTSDPDEIAAKMEREADGARTRASYVALRCAHAWPATPIVDVM